MKIFYDCGFHKGKITDKFLKENEDAICYAFEPNELMNESNKWCLDKYPNRISLSHDLVWVEDTELDFWIGIKDMQGSSVIPTKRNLTDKVVKRKAIDFNEFIINTSSHGDYIVLKMDIEGSEYPVLKKLIENDTIKRINEITVEFHNGRLGTQEYTEIHDFLKEYFDTVDWMNSKTLWRL